MKISEFTERNKKNIIKMSKDKLVIFGSEKDITVPFKSNNPLGFDEVVQLDGGILKYLETVPESDSKWQGECFLFDNRVSVKNEMQYSMLLAWFGT